MAGADLTALSNILKEYYLGPVVDQLNKQVFLLSRLEARSEDLVGKRAYVPLSAARTGGIGSRGELQALPTAGNYTYDKAVYDLKYLYGRAQVSGPSMAKTKSEAGAFLQALKSELDGLRLDLQKDLSRQIYGDGTGVVAGVSAIAAASGGAQVITLDDNEALRKGQLYVGMVVDVLTSTSNNAVVQYGATLPITAVSVDDTTPTITVTNVGGALATSSVSAFVITRAGARTASGYPNGDSTSGPLSNEVDGLARIVSTTAALGGIDPTAAGKEWWKAQTVTPEAGVNGSGTRNISFDDIQKALNKARIAGGNPTSIITSHGVHREFYNLFTNNIRYQEPSDLNYQAGFKTLLYAGMPVVADLDAPYGTMYILDESTLKVFSDQDWHFLDADGLTLRQVPSTDAFEAIMVRYMNVGATRRNNQIVISGIAVDGAKDLGF